MPDSLFTVDVPLSAAQALLLNEVCARFEAAWKAAGPADPAPRIEAFLSGASRRSSILLRRLVLLDVNHRRRRGGRPTASEYEARFPDLSGRLFAGAFPRPPRRSQPRRNRRKSQTTCIAWKRPCCRPPSGRSCDPSATSSASSMLAAASVRSGWPRTRRSAARLRSKRLRPNHEEQKDRFLVEAQVTGQLEHPGIVPVHDLGVDEEGRPFYVMSFIHGRTLKDVIAEHHADGPHGGESREVRNVRLLEIFVKICQAVAYAHHRGVLHRDLKPDNVMLGPFGEVLVLDWGMAKVHSQPEPGEGTRRCI